MKIKLVTIILLSLGLVFLIVIPALVDNVDGSGLPFKISGRTEGNGTFFEITDSDYLNIYLQSSEEITVRLESVPKIISLHIEASSIIDSSILTFSNLEPNKTYYKYQDSYKNENEFITDENGIYSWIQNLTQFHHIWFQEEKSTTYIDQDTVLDSDITGSVEINVSGVTLDCNGRNITGDGTGYGIYLYDKTNVTVKNCNVSNFSYGIYLGGSLSMYNTITNNNVFANEYGFTVASSAWWLRSSNNYILENQIYSNVYWGIELYATSHNQVIGNSASNNGGIGFLLNWAPDNYLRNNSIVNNEYNFGVYGGWVVAPQDLDTSNTVNGKPIYYLVNEKDKTIDASLNPGYVGIINSENITIKDITISGNVQGIYLENTIHSRIENTHLSNNLMGIWMYLCSENEVIGNEISENISWGGIILGISAYNIFSYNDILNNGMGIWLTAPSGTYSHHNKIYHNNFKNNQAHIIAGTTYNDSFDDGYPSGGNYWSGYTGVDLYSGPNQDQPGSDGIGDTPYTFYYVKEDRYPFMNESGWEGPQKWSFAIITDIHIGQGSSFLDYGNLGWNDDNSGQEPTKATKDLRDIVNVINLNKGKYNIAFVVVDGDFTNSAELSELNKAKDILNDLEIPWVPIIGNHDIWPYTALSEAPEVSEPDKAGTDKFFNDIFNSQYEKLKDIFQNWKKAGVPVWNPETDPNHYSFFQNFTFDFNGYHFIGLDFNHRDDEIILPGSSATGNLHNFSSGSWDWLVSDLMQYYHNHSEEQEKVILLAHHPFRKHYSKGLFNIGFSEYELNTINNFLKDYKDKIAFEFAGHTHDKKISNFKDIMTVVETQANVEGPVTRIVQIYTDGKIDYSQLLPEKMMIVEGHSPIDLEVIDPDGLIINKQFNEIPGASYFEEDIDEDDEPDDIIEIPERKIGDYQIRVIPEDGANPEDTYTLEVSVLEDTFGYVPILLTENIPISEIPTEPYLLESKERKATQITHTGELNGQYSDLVNLSAVLNDIDGNPLANETVNFEIGEQSISAITNESGVVSAVLSLNQIPGKYYLVEASFAGDEDYLPSTDSEYFEILKENTIINVIEKEGFAFDEVILEAQIKDGDGQVLLSDAEIEFKIDNKILGTVKINGEGMATVSWQADLIPKQLTETYPIEAIFTGNDYYQSARGQGNFVLKSAKWLKQDVVSELESAKTGNKKIDKEIDRIILFINQSLNENLWIGASHLVFFEKGKCENLNLEKILDKDELDLDGINLKRLKSGIVVFYYERMATKLMMPKPAFKVMIGKLVKADKLLAQVSLFDAKNTPIKNPKLQKIIENQIKKAEQEIQKGETELQKNRPDKAITRLAKSWLHSQLAIKLANF